jgi:hypothetical protein
MWMQSIIIIIIITISSSSSSMAVQTFVGPWQLFFSFLTLYTVSRTP